MGVIATESSSLGSSSNTSHWLYPVFYFLAPQFTLHHFELAHSALRKMGHFVGYATLSVFMLGAWWATLNQSRLGTRLWRTIRRRWDARAASLAFLCSALVATLDEWHQMSMPSRTGAFHDILLDSAAAACAQLLLLAFTQQKGEVPAVR